MRLITFFGICLGVCVTETISFNNRVFPLQKSSLAKPAFHYNKCSTRSTSKSRFTLTPQGIGKGTSRLNALRPLSCGRSLLSVSPAQQKLSLMRDGKDRTGSFFICQLGGAQKWLEKGRFYDVPRIKGKAGSRIMLTRVTTYQSAEGEVLVGQPFLEQVRPIASILGHFRGPKHYRLKYKRKKRYRRLHGWRVEMSRIRIDSCIVQPGRVIQSGEWRGYSSDPLFQLVTMAMRSPHPPGQHPTGGFKWPKSLINMWTAAREYKPITRFKLPRDEPEPMVGFDVDEASRFSRLLQSGSATVSPYNIHMCTVHNVHNVEHAQAGG